MHLLSITKTATSQSRLPDLGMLRYSSSPAKRKPHYHILDPPCTQAIPHRKPLGFGYRLPFLSGLGRKIVQKSNHQFSSMCCRRLFAFSSCKSLLALLRLHLGPADINLHLLFLQGARIRGLDFLQRLNP